MSIHFEVESIEFIESAKYDDVYLRPYTTRYDSSISNHLMDVTNSGRDVTTNDLYSVASQIITPQTTATHRANLANGFGEKRFVFRMVLNSQSNGMQVGGNLRYIVTGYTNHLGVSSLNGQQNLDPNMQLFFNNIYVLRNRTENTPHGMRTVSYVADSIQIILNTPGDQLLGYMGTVEAQYTMRPEDIFRAIHIQNDPRFQEFRQMNYSIDDQSSTVMGLKGTKRSDNSAPSYLSNVFKSYNASLADESVYGGFDDESSDTWEVAQKKSRNAALSSNRFLSTVFAQTTMRQSGFITYADLCGILPGVDHIAKVFSMGRQDLSVAYQPGQHESLRANTHEALAATIAQQSTPSIMSDTLMQSVYVRATNNHIGLAHHVDVMPMSFTDGLDMTRFIEAFKHRFINEVLAPISQFNQITYDLTLEIDIYRDCRIQISLDGQPAVPFTVPAFCDGLYAPVLTGDLNNVNSMASDIELMVLNMGGDLNRMVTEQPTQQIIQQPTQQQQSLDFPSNMTFQSLTI